MAPPGEVFAPRSAQEAAVGLAALAQAGRTVRIGAAARANAGAPTCGWRRPSSEESAR